MTNICRVCGKEFEANVRNKKTCPECAQTIFNRINNTDKTDVCLVCGKIINEKPNRWRRYCGDSCKNIAHYISYYYSVKKREKKSNKKRKENTVKARYRKMDDMEMQARKAGMDYGTYTAMMRINNNQ